jgi:transcriptional regulator with XRE-family HTH domain
MDDTPPVPAPLLGERVRRARAARSMSQAELAAQMAVPPRWIADLETGPHPHVDTEALARLCQVLAVSADYLLGHIDRPRPLHAPAGQPAPPVARTRRQRKDEA